MKPQNMSIKQGWSALKEARKGNGISQAIYNKFADVNAMPYINDPEMSSIKTYDDFRKYHTRVWLMD